MSSDAKKSAKKSRKGFDFVQVQTRLPKAQKDMARPSVLVKLDDPEFMEKFTQLFEEHIEGFTGLRGSRREKQEKDKGMEWRVRLRAKQLQTSSHDSILEKTTMPASKRRKRSEIEEGEPLSSTRLSNQPEKISKVMKVSNNKTAVNSKPVGARDDAINRYRQLKKTQQQQRGGGSVIRGSSQGKSTSQMIKSIRKTGGGIVF